jgi:hypothetical protein
VSGQKTRSPIRISWGTLDANSEKLREGELGDHSICFPTLQGMCLYITPKADLEMDGIAS